MTEDISGFVDLRLLQKPQYNLKPVTVPRLTATTLSFFSQAPHSVEYGGT